LVQQMVADRFIQPGVVSPGLVKENIQSVVTKRSIHFVGIGN
jgi:hypothetical protein